MNRTFGYLLLGSLSLLALGAPVRADEIYRCKTYGGGLFWSPTHCQQHGALIDRIESVPAGMGFERQVRVAEQGQGRAGKAAARIAESRPAKPSRAEQLALRREARARARQQARCDRLQAELDRQQGFSRQQLTARRQEFIRNKQQQLRQQRELAGC